MNDIPIMWATELQEAYPDRSGINGWGSVRLLLALRTALQNDTWERIIDGCKRYKTYCQKTGIEGSVYVQAPYRFISEQSYLETFEHKAPEDPKIIEARQKEQERWANARTAGGSLGSPLHPFEHESVGSFETRIRFAQNSGVRVRPADDSGSGSMGGDAQDNRQLSNRIADLTQRLRIAK